jgi:hypothetical protein
VNSTAERCETAASRSSTLITRKLSTEPTIANLRPTRAPILTSLLRRRTALLGARRHRPLHRDDSRSAARGSD